jgi:hypothetical protein
MFLITALTTGLSGNLFSQILGVNAQNGSAFTPEAMLTVEYPNGTLLSSAILKIKDNLADKNLDSVSIISISNKLDFEGKTQTFTETNEDNKNSTNFANSFKKSQNAFFKTLAGFKQADNRGQDYEDEEEISPLVDKYSVETISPKPQPSIAVKQPQLQV